MSTSNTRKPALKPSRTRRPTAASIQEADAGVIAEGAPQQAEQPRPGAGPALPGGKLGVLVGLLRRPAGATITDLTSATSWQAHSVRGALAGSLKKKLGFAVTSEKAEGGRVYRIAP